MPRLEGLELQVITPVMPRGIGDLDGFLLKFIHTYDTLEEFHLLEDEALDIVGLVRFRLSKHKRLKRLVCHPERSDNSMGR